MLISLVCDKLATRNTIHSCSAQGNSHPRKRSLIVSHNNCRGIRLQGRGKYSKVGFKAGPLDNFTPPFVSHSVASLKCNHYTNATITCGPKLHTKRLNAHIILHMPLNSTMRLPFNFHAGKNLIHYTARKCS